VVDRSELLGARRVVILASNTNRPALRLYRNVGFVRSQDAELEDRLTANDPAGLRRVLLELPMAGVVAPRGSYRE